MFRVRLAFGASLISILSLAGASGVQARAIHSVTNQANLVADGGFESPAVLECGTGYIPGAGFGPWHVVGSSGGGVLQVTSCYINPSEGSNSLLLEDGGPGGVSQALKTTAGTTYDLHFAVAGISFACGARSLSASAKRLVCGNRKANAVRLLGGQGLHVLVNGKVVHSTNVLPSGNRSQPGWICPSFDYTAKTTVSALEFLATSSNAPVIDDVRVTKESGLNVSGVLPNVFGSGTNLAAKVYGSGFTKSSKVSFSDKNITVSKVQYIGQDQLNITYTRPAGPAATSDVTVTNGGASDTCGRALSVTAAP
ncbi:MAG TPA: hypothetical protein VG815_13360 [Chloroflexota bacterium]|jgi:hypothetical protein|nr:hypothetical protein [Chloroflexota bacterium]